MIPDFISLIPPLLKQLPEVKTYWVAFSGGIDSHVLLHVLHNYHLEHPSAFQLRALHVNHQLQEAAINWPAHCQKICADLGIPCDTITLSIQLDKSESIEATAREARYQALKKFIGQDDCLLTAHHQDDQSETFLLQLFRGAGVKGLAAMPFITTFAEGFLARPFLNVTREDILHYAKTHQLNWIDDPTNVHTDRDRNYIRHQLMPLIKRRWPSSAPTISRSANHCADADYLLRKLAEEDLKKVKAKEHTLSVKALLQFDSKRLANILRHWLIRENLTLPNEKKLQQIISSVLSAKSDSSPWVKWRGGNVRRYRDELIADVSVQTIPENETWHWDLLKPLYLPNDLGVLEASQKKGEGFVIPDHFIDVRFNVSGLACQLKNRKGHHKLKKLYQEWGIPPWQRRVTPLLFQDNELVSIVGQVISEPYLNQSDEVEGWIIVWKKSL